MQIVLVHPQIPPNTGNVARLCAATGLPLHLVRPLGFRITDRDLKRAGLDYWAWVDLHLHDSLEDFLDSTSDRRLCFFSTKASRSYLEAEFREGDSLVFGSETAGLPQDLHREFGDSFYRIPIFNSHVRSLNLSSAVAIVAYEALRQTGRLG